ncbi:bifunctional UDP-N-acetylglucosamine diphosphorylase/glucosamine-1-phosphate N-acetyltransferase GlmU [Nocardioides marmorisolisilvae]|uniref:Bifunctional protein GlmU n=1 Tax=Nocardioides marmorisolisilvae TaxID=1542737 RepID=A0A3N0DRT6_9ACTN|nr:bifunctional UDP-N-acetylglucosamine diphosphorylase/glucosamine-1-phosphate N-acetyltransferase GlmU [Nocardioides marmorisolisilvae]RNL78335.1 bifunctional UDP-N-acetylglucosamine diphosphorylase/glucosamine-1-phosphate N-acetyltransferase GlmU [Nocardioides marmorisolisilvae]
MSTDLTVIVLAAGGGTRMKSKTMKVLHQIAGRSMIGHVLHAASALEPARIVAVVGNQREQVSAHVAELVPGIVLAVQETQDGTGHAVRMAWEALPADQRSGTVLIAYGDMPMLEGESLRAFVEFHRAGTDAISILTGIVADPHGYGRIVRGDDGGVEAIVEQKDASEEQAAIAEINSGILAFDADFLDGVLPRLGNQNAAGEYYLTDTVSLARGDGRTVGAFVLEDVMQTEGVNDRAQLATLAAEMNRRILDRWMRSGVTIIDPSSTWIDADVKLEPDVTILPGVQLLGTTVVAEDAVVGPDSTLRDVEIGAGAKVVRTHGELAVIGAGANVGPFSYLRPGTELGAGGKIGAFVETKNAQIGDGAKVPHLSYVGDATIGEGANIGAGTIFANYDGVKKHRTTIGAHAKTASNNTFVAPVTVGDGAATGAGSVIRRDIPPGTLAVTSGPQRHYDEWAQAKRPGTDQAKAAEAAMGAEGAEVRPDAGTPTPDVGDAATSE